MTDTQSKPQSQAPMKQITEQEFKTQGVAVLNKILNPEGLPPMFTIDFEHMQCTADEDERWGGSFKIAMAYGNCRQQHRISIGYSNDDGLGLDLRDDGELEEITAARVMASMYFDLALADLDDKYLH